MSDRPHPIDPKLLEILICPVARTPLVYDAAEAGTDQPPGQPRLPDPRRHSDPVAG